MCRRAALLWILCAAPIAHPQGNRDRQSDQGKPEQCQQDLDARGGETRFSWRSQLTAILRWPFVLRRRCLRFLFLVRGGMERVLCQSRAVGSKGIGGFGSDSGSNAPDRGGQLLQLAVSGFGQG